MCIESCDTTTTNSVRQEDGKIETREATTKG